MHPKGQNDAEFSASAFFHNSSCASLSPLLTNPRAFYKYITVLKLCLLCKLALPQAFLFTAWSQAGFDFETKLGVITCAVANTDLTLTLLLLEPKSFSKPRRFPTPISHPGHLPNDKSLWSSPRDLPSHKEGRENGLH